MKGNSDALVEVTFFVDTAVTLSETAAAALASIATLNDLYDAAKSWKCQAQAVRLEYPTAATQPVTASGTALNLGSLNFVIDPSTDSAFAINTSTNTITAKATTLAVGSKFAELQTTGTIGFANGGAASARLSGILTYGTPGAITQSLGIATLRFSTAGTYDLRGATISGTLTLVNTSGGAVTVQLQPGVTFVNSGPNITVDNSPPPTFQSVTISNGVAGTLLLIQDITNPASPITLYLNTPSTWPHVWTDTNPYAADRDIRVRAAYQSGATAKLFIDEEIGTSTQAAPAISYRLNQVNDATYIANAIDGSTITSVTIDDAALLVEVDTGTISWAEIYAHEVYWLATTAGIVDEGRIITALDPANYVFEGPWQIKNVSSPSVPLVITGGYGRSAVDGTTLTMIDTSGGTVFATPDQVIAFATGSGVTAQDKTDIIDGVWNKVLP
jgi:hypothetical protein